MGRPKKQREDKKINLTLNLEIQLFNAFEKLEIKNKSKFFNWLLKEHLAVVEGGCLGMGGSI